jgi:hypothetical protein
MVDQGRLDRAEARFESSGGFGSLRRLLYVGNVLPPQSMGGRVVLDVKFCASVFLCVRIFSSDGAAVKSPAQPSGFVFDWDWGGVALLLQASSRVQGLDCLLAIFFRVFSVKVCGLFVIFFYFLGLPVTIHPPLK